MMTIMGTLVAELDQSLGVTNGNADQDLRLIAEDSARITKNIPHISSLYKFLEVLKGIGRPVRNFGSRGQPTTTTNTAQIGFDSLQARHALAEALQDGPFQLDLNGQRIGASPGVADEQTIAIDAPLPHLPGAMSGATSEHHCAPSCLSMEPRNSPPSQHYPTPPQAPTSVIAPRDQGTNIECLQQDHELSALKRRVDVASSSAVPNTLGAPVSGNIDCASTSINHSGQNVNPRGSTSQGERLPVPVDRPNPFTGKAIAQSLRRGVAPFEGRVKSLYEATRLRP
jgi:hypothetical protein